RMSLASSKSTTKSTSLSRRASPRATDPQTRRLVAPWPAAIRSRLARRAASDDIVGTSAVLMSPSPQEASVPSNEKFTCRAAGETLNPEKPSCRRGQVQRLIRRPYRSGTDRIPESLLDHPPRARENNCMNNKATASDLLANSEHSDTEAVLRHAFERAPLDP